MSTTLNVLAKKALCPPYQAANIVLQTLSVKKRTLSIKLRMQENYLSYQAVELRILSSASSSWEIKDIVLRLIELWNQGYCPPSYQTVDSRIQVPEFSDVLSNSGIKDSVRRLIELRMPH